MLQFKPQITKGSHQPLLQTSLKIGQRGDKYEREADAVADRVMRMSEQDTMQMQPIEEEEEEAQPKLRMQPKRDPDQLANLDFVSQQLKNSGNGDSLSASTNRFMSNAFGNDFGGVQVHTDSKAVQMNQQLGARAFTVANHIYFNNGEYKPEDASGKKLLAHELTHVVQQGSGPIESRVQRDDIEVRSPLFEAAVTQISNLDASIQGRALLPDEIRLARSVFGDSLDYTRINLVQTSFLQWRTIANTIRVPTNFSITDSYMSETFIHEMTHVWQYQHEGTSYISTSLSDQLVGYIRTGSRNAAYRYNLVPGKTFFEYRAEQQAMIVQHYFNLLREQANPDTTAARNTQITQQLALYQPLIAQMNGALPRTEAELLLQSASEAISIPNYSLGQDQFLIDQETIPEERRMMPITPILDIRFDVGF